MPKKTDRLEIRCTCCDAVLTVDRTTGDVLFTEKPKKKNLSFDEALNKVHADKETADDRFNEAFEREKARLKAVEGKFEEALKRKDELEEPIRPLDYD
ncbi:MAG TPA: hypothetical protein VFY29_01520 [Terriglobia bacterium]|nr:hypothetical protein [Terriglobia bacterium]